MSKEELKEKKKLKKKPLILLLIIIVLLIGAGGIFLYLNNQKTLNNISKYYNQYVITTKKTKLYDKNKKEVGTIEKDISLELDKANKNEYFKIKDTDFYIYYEDIKKGEKIDTPQISENIIVFNSNIKTKKGTELYKDNKSIIKLNTSLNIPIQFQDNDYYYVLLFNRILGVKKTSNDEIIENENTKEKTANQVSVLYYFDIENECNNYNCVKKEDAKNQLKKLKEEGYSTLSANEFGNFLYGNIQVKEKSLFVITTNPNDITKSIEEELGIKIEIEDPALHFNAVNKPAVKNVTYNINKYQIKSYTPIENVLKMANGEDVSEQDPTPPNNQAIAVLNYHFFYDPNQGETCNEGICLTTDKFREHLQYFKDEGFKTLTMNEFMRWMYGEIELPEKSVLITIDDGAMGTGKHNGNKLIPLLEEYDEHATLFLITGWWDISNYQSPNLDIQSHTNDMHQYGDCGRGQLVCYSYDKAKADLEQSLAVIGSTDSFCYPFYSYSDTAIQAVKDTGFKIAFAGGNRKATRNSNKWLIPRYPIHADVTLDQIKQMVN